MRLFFVQSGILDRVYNPWMDLLLSADNLSLDCS